MKLITIVLFLFALTSCATTKNYSHTENDITITGSRIRTGLHTEVISVKREPAQTNFVASR
jgi:hypothetical protein